MKEEEKSESEQRKEIEDRCDGEMEENCLEIEVNVLIHFHFSITMAINTCKK